MYTVFGFLLAMPKRKILIYFLLFKFGFEVLAGWLNAGVCVRSVYCVTTSGPGHVVCWSISM